MAGDQTFSNGEYIFREGESAVYGYIVKSGNVEIVKHGAAGDQVLAELEPPTIFGEMALILQQNRSATITSVQSTELISISKENLDELINSGSKAAQKVILNLCKELAKRNEFQNVLYSHDEIDEIIESENQIIKKITKQILLKFLSSKIIIVL